MQHGPWRALPTGSAEARQPHTQIDARHQAEGQGAVLSVEGMGSSKAKEQGKGTHVAARYPAVHRSVKTPCQTSMGTLAAQSTSRRKFGRTTRDAHEDFEQTLHASGRIATIRPSPHLLQHQAPARSIPTGPAPCLVQADAPIGEKLRR